MGGALLQLVAYGAQDIYLTGNPQVTFFKMVYKKHTNFAIGQEKLVFTGTVDFDKKSTCIINRHGDLLSNVFLCINLPALTEKILDYSSNDGVEFWTNNTTASETKEIIKSKKIFNKKYLNQHQIISWTNSIAYAIIDYVSIDIGGQIVDKHYGEWLNIWNELTITESKKNFNNVMLGKYNFDEWFTKGIYNNALKKKLYIPLQFWFCRNNGLSLPLIALQHHEVKIHIKLNKFEKCWYNVHMNKSNKKMPVPEKVNIESAYLLCNYIFLDTDERRRFAKGSHEYLIDQLQCNTRLATSGYITDIKIPLNFNHPIKELVWATQKGVVNETNDWFNYSNDVNVTLGDYNNVSDYLNHEIIVDNEISYDSEYLNTNYVFLNKYRTTTYTSMEASLSEIKKNILNTSNEYNTMNTPMIKKAKLLLNGMDRFDYHNVEYFSLLQPYLYHSCTPKNFDICVYSFCLSPEKEIPTGSCNFSRIDSAELIINLNDSDYDVIDKSNNNYTIVYATNFNILRIMNGMGGLAYSN